ncbi:MAG TPA: dUTP diphosphatase [Candidatus Binataceae bacterium]
MDLIIKLKRVRGRGLPLPEYHSGGAAGMDLLADVEQTVTLWPLERCAVPTGIAVEIPAGFEGQVRPRSGRALREGLTLLNTPGTIDSDYRGEIQVILINLGRDSVTINPGDRIAQLVIAPVARATLVEVEELTDTHRGGCGFGHTGT